MTTVAGQTSQPPVTISVKHRNHSMKTHQAAQDTLCNGHLSFPAIDSGKVAQTDSVCHLFRLLSSGRLKHQKTAMDQT